MTVLPVQFIHYWLLQKQNRLNRRKQFMLITGFYYLVCLSSLFFYEEIYFLYPIDQLAFRHKFNVIRAERN